MSEHQEQVALFQALSLHPECRWIFTTPNGGLRSKTTAVNLVREGLKKGAWDIFIPLARQGFHGMFIEMKYGKNKLTPEQAEFGEFVSEQGYKTFVSYNWQDAYNAIVEYMGLEPKVE